MFLIFSKLGHARPAPVFAHRHALGSAGATAAALLLLLAATGKSAQIPLFNWLPDAMEGPTPVSALIHAATMVTAGVYLLCRMNPILALSPDAMWAVAIIGGVTAFVAATIATSQQDIKKVAGLLDRLPDRLHDAGRRDRAPTWPPSSSWSPTPSTRASSSSGPAR